MNNIPESPETQAADAVDVHDAVLMESRMKRFAGGPESIVRNREALLSVLNYEADKNVQRLMPHVHYSGKSSPYWPAANVIRVLFYMFRVTSTRGYPEFVDSANFNSTDQRITSLKEFQILAWKLYGVEISRDQAKRSLKALHDAKFVFKTHGRCGNIRNVLYIRMMGGRMLAALKGKLWEGLSTNRVEFSLQGGTKGEVGVRDTQTTSSGQNVSRAQICAHSYDIVDVCPDNSAGKIINTPTETDFVPTDNFPDGPKRKEFLSSPAEQGRDGGKSARGFNNLTETGGVEFSLTGQVQQILNFIQTHRLFLNEDRQHAPVALTPQQVRLVARLVESRKLTLSLLRKYKIAVGGAGLCDPERMRDEWWLYLTLEQFCRRIKGVKTALRITETSHRLSFEVLPEKDGRPDLDSLYKSWIASLENFEINIRDGSPVYMRAWLCGYPKEGALEPGKALIATDLLKGNHPSELLEEIRIHNRPAALRWFQQQPVIYFALKQNGHDMPALLGIDDETPLTEAYHRFQVQWLGQIRQAKRTQKALPLKYRPLKSHK